MADVARAAARVLLVGELNPYGADPYFALYHLPRGASGDRLREILGLSDEAYARCFSKVNLCTGRWSAPAARARAQYLLETFREEVLVLLGARVRGAFGGPPFFETAAYVPSEIQGVVNLKILLSLPHPSGRCLLWNEPGARGRAASALRAVAPWVYHQQVGDAVRRAGNAVEGS